MIYHVVTRTQWEAALKEGAYRADSLNTEGFIHACKESQLVGVLKRYYQGQADLLLLHIDESMLTAELKYELSLSVNDEFPHIFGALNTEAVLKAEPI
jgi:uncharacterized protein (DUF952 family)